MRSSSCAATAAQLTENYVNVARITWSADAPRHAAAQPRPAGGTGGSAPNSLVARRMRVSAQRPSALPPQRSEGAATGAAAAAHAAAAAEAAGRNAAREVAVLGGEDFILSQRSGVEDELFKGEVLGVDADVARVDFRQQPHLASLSHLPQGLEAPPRFLDRVAVHYARNALAGKGALLGQVPLVLGIWGPKGVGKTFTLELCLRQMGVVPVSLSAGEMEDEWAGEPGRRLRERYSFAARHAESTGQATCLVISDLDAGAGTYDNVQKTVNNQNLQGTLMALCDDPLAVSTGQDWGAVRPRSRVPIYVTANDLTTLYAPLVREGRMDKFYYEPTREEMAGALCALFAPRLADADVDALLDAFPDQPMDFFGSIQSRLVDASVRRWLSSSSRGGGSMQDLSAVLLAPDGSRLPQGVEPELTLASALVAGAALAAEQQAVMDIRLSREYMKGLDADIQEAGERQERWRAQGEQEAARRVAAAAAAEAARAKAAEAAWARGAEARQQRLQQQRERRDQQGQCVDSVAVAESQGEEEEERERQALQAPQPPPTASGLPAVTPDELAAGLKSKTLAVLDVRGAREWDWGRIKGASHAACIIAAGSSLAPETRPNPGFLEAARKALGPPDGGERSQQLPIVLYGPGAPLDTDTNAAFVSKEQFVSIAPNGAAVVDGEDVVAAAARQLAAAGYGARLAGELVGGYRGWDLAYRPDGRRRAKGAFRDKSSGELEWWTASN